MVEAAFVSHQGQERYSAYDDCNTPRRSYNHHHYHHSSPQDEDFSAPALRVDADVAIVEECLAQSDDVFALAQFAAEEFVQRHLEDSPLAVAAALDFERDFFHGTQLSVLFTNARRIS